jgi:hypothetical protein
MIKTSCEKCIFKLGEDQYGCYLGKLEKYLEKNLATKENGYYTIGKLCGCCRDTSTLTDLKKEAELVKQENKTNFYLFINCCDNEVIPQKTIESLKSLNYPNLTAHFLFNSGKFVKTYGEINTLIGGDLKFRVSKVAKGESIDYTVTSVLEGLGKNYFVGFMDGGNELESNVFEEIDNKINDQLDALVCYVDQNIVLIYNNVLSVLSNTAPSGLDLDYYLDATISWLQLEGKMDLLCVKE